MALDWNRGGLKALKVTAKIGLVLTTALVGALAAALVSLAGVLAYSLVTTGSAALADQLLKNAIDSLGFTAADAIIQNIAFAAVAVFFLVAVDRQRLWPKERPGRIVASAARWFAFGAALDAAFAVLYVISVILTGVSGVKTSGLAVYSPAAIAVTLATFLALAFFVGLGEEMLFRRYIQNYLTGQYGVAVALVAASFIFAVMHTISQPQPLAIAGIFLVSVILGYLYVITGSIWAPIGFHFFEDFVALGIVPMGSPYFGGSPLFIFAQARDVVLFGVNLGPEDNLISIVLALAFLAGLYGWHRHSKRNVRQKT